MELVLDRDLANERIFPAINLAASGTRREELLFGPAVAEHQKLRRSVARMSPKDAMLNVLKLIDQYPTNELLLAQSCEQHLTRHFGKMAQAALVHLWQGPHEYEV